MRQQVDLFVFNGRRHFVEHFAARIQAPPAVSGAGFFRLVGVLSKLGLPFGVLRLDFALALEDFAAVVGILALRRDSFRASHPTRGARFMPLLAE